MAKARERPPVRGPNRRPDQRSGPHQATRKAHEAETAEDYAEAIADLIEGDGEARVTDLARRLGVTHVTVIRTVDRLRRAGLVTTRPYRSIFLTEEGRRVAARAHRRHEIVYNFLRAIGVGDSAARIDAEGIEHHVGPETLRIFERFLGGRARRV